MELIILNQNTNYLKKDINLFLINKCKRTLLSEIGLHTNKYIFYTRDKLHKIRKFNGTGRRTRDILELYNYPLNFTKYNIIKKRKDKIDFVHYYWGLIRNVQLYTDLESKQVYFFIKDVKYILNWIKNDIKTLSKYKVKRS